MIQRRRNSATTLLAVLSFVILAATSAFPVSAQQNPLPARRPIDRSADRATARVIVKFAANASAADISDIVRREGLAHLRYVGRTGARLLRTSPGTELAVIDRLLALPSVEYAEPDYLAHADLIPTDPFYAVSQADLSLIGMPAAWDATLGSSSVVPAVIDTGIATNHPDLIGQWSYAPGRTAAEHVFLSSPDTRCPAAPTPEDDGWQGPSNPFSHGTHVSGTIAAQMNNGAGIAGMAPAARILPLKVLDCTGSGSFSDIDSAIIFAADNGASLINMSLGANLGNGCPSATQDAINYAVSRGVFVAAAAGNSGTPQISYPAGCANTVSVGATTNVNTRASFSQNPNSTTAGVDVAAPGVGISSTYRTTAGVYDYIAASGTSMATPHVVGCAALIRAANPAAGPAQVESLLESTALDLSSAGWDPDFRYPHGHLHPHNHRNDCAPDRCAIRDTDAHVDEHSRSESDPHVYAGARRIPVGSAGGWASGLLAAGRGEWLPGL